MNKPIWRFGKELPEIPARPSGLDEADGIAAALEGIHGPFRYYIFDMRTFLFLKQYVKFDGASITHLACEAYERIRSADELVTVMRLHENLTERGVASVSRRPIHVSLVVPIFPSIYDAPDGIVPFPETDERYLGEHIVPLIGFEEGYFYFLSGWPDWGINSIGAISLDYVEHFKRESLLIRGTVGPCPAGESLSGNFLVPKGGPGPSPERLSELPEYTWDGHGDSPFFILRQGLELRGSGRLDIAGRWLTGVCDGSVWLQCVAILFNEANEPIVVGWIHIRGTFSGGIVEELFVWPPYREHGIATTLSGEALFHIVRNPKWRHSSWEWHVSEADAMVRDRSERRPNIPSWLSSVTSVPQGTTTSLLDLLARIADAQSTHSKGKP